VDHIKPFDNQFPFVSGTLTRVIREYMQALIPAHGVGWAQEAVLLTLLDGAGAIGGLCGISKAELINRLTERYDHRREEATQHAEGSLIVPRERH